MTTEELKKRFSENLKSERKAKGYSQERLAEIAQLSTQMINDIEGCRRWPSDKTISKIITALNIDVSSLFKSQITSDDISGEMKKMVCDEIEELIHKSISSYLESK